MTQEMVHSSGVVTVEEDNSWRYGEKNTNDSVSVTIVPELFKTADNKYLTGVGPKATTVYIRSGIPLAKITSGTNVGSYGPYDKTASDGRQTKIAGLSESQITVNINMSGWDLDDPLVGMTFRGDIVKSNLPVKPEDTAVWGGEFYDVENDVVTPLSAAAGVGPKGADGASVTAIKLTKDGSNNITGGTATLSNGHSVTITVA